MENYYTNSVPAPADCETIGVVIPAYKEQDNIALLIKRIHGFVPSARIVIIDDSPDLVTMSAVEGSRALLPKPNLITAVHRERKEGRGSAILAGMRHLRDAGCGRVVEMDADFSPPPEEIPALLRSARESGLDLLIASRYLPGSRIENWPIRRRLFSRVANLLARLLLRIPVSDYTNGFRIYSPRAVAEVCRSCGNLGRGFIALSEILVKLDLAGCRIGEAPTRFVNRNRGESSVTCEELRWAVAGIVRIFLFQRNAQRAPGQ